MTAGSPDREAARRHDEAIAAGQFGKALSIVTVDLMTQLIRLLRERGFEVEFNRPPSNSTEFFGGVASAIQDRIEQEGEAAPYVLTVGLELATALLGLQTLLQRPRPDDVTEADDVALVLLQSMTVGSRAEFLGLMLSGHYDEFVGLRTKSDDMRERRRLGAAVANEKRRGPRKAAFDNALERCLKNPRLSNEDLALRVKADLSLPTSIRTMSGWMRDWRRGGQLPPLKN
jgi:hypothetical protein